MKINTYLVIILFLSAVISGFADDSLKNQNEYGYISVLTESKVIYDDGIERTVYEGYEILNDSNKLILEVGFSYDEPKTVKLPVGKYVIRYIKENAVKKKTVSVKAGIIKEVCLF